jgi:hypothetical protein
VMFYRCLTIALRYLLMVSEVFMLRPILLFLILLQSLCALGQSPEAVLEEKLHLRVQSYTISAANLLEALAKVSDDFELRMGIEWDISSLRCTPVSAKYEDTTQLKIIEDLMSTEPLYQFTAANGIIHVSNKAIVGDPRNFLNLRIPDFQVSSEYVGHARNRLYKIVEELMTKPKGEQESYACGGSYSPGWGDRLTSFHLHNVNVRDILDRFVTSAGYNIWLVTFPDTSGSTIRGFFVTKSVFSPNLPESELPVWDLLVPGYDPVRKQFGIDWPRGTWQPTTKEAAN